MEYKAESTKSILRKRRSLFALARVHELRLLAERCSPQSGETQLRRMALCRGCACSYGETFDDRERRTVPPAR